MPIEREPEGKYINAKVLSFIITNSAAAFR